MIASTMQPRRGRWGVALLLCALALAIRALDFGNPVIHVDEQWYLLVGDRLLHGAVPYLDLWDRKPVGLFLLYAGLRWLGGMKAEGGILAYQLAATAAAAATAIVVAGAARLVGANGRGAAAAGLAYLLGLTLLGGRGGQAPVFYDLPVAIAGLMCLRLPRLADERRIGAIVASGALACLLAGVAIQVKQTAAVEGAFVGLAHLWFLRRAGAAWPVVALVAGVLAAIGLAPTVAAGGWYAAHGAFGAWWFANFTSITLRPPYPADQLAMRLLGIAAQLAPLLLAGALAWRRGRHLPAWRVAAGWLGAALVAFAMVGTWFDHYALPLLAPLAVVAAPMLGRSTRLLVAALGIPLTIAIVERATMRDDDPGARAVAAVVARESRGGCPYVFIGDPVTYLLSGTCLPTAYAFPNLLAYSTEQGATGIDEAAEVRRVLAGQPPVIVTSDRRLAIWNAASLAALKGALREYQLVLSVPRAGWHTLVYVRRPELEPAAPRQRLSCAPALQAVEGPRRQMGSLKRPAGRACASQPDVADCRASAPAVRPCRAAPRVPPSTPRSRHPCWPAAWQVGPASRPSA